MVKTNFIVGFVFCNLFKHFIEEKPPRFTFQELVDMIEKGIEIPGNYYIYIYIKETLA